MVMFYQQDQKFDTWLFVAKYTKFGKFVKKLEKICIEGRYLWPLHFIMDKHCVQFSSQEDY